MDPTAVSLLSSASYDELRNLLVVARLWNREALQNVSAAVQASNRGPPVSTPDVVQINLSDLLQVAQIGVILAVMIGAALLLLIGSCCLCIRLMWAQDWNMRQYAPPPLKENIALVSEKLNEQAREPFTEHAQGGGSSG